MISPVDGVICTSALVPSFMSLRLRTDTCFSPWFSSLTNQLWRAFSNFRLHFSGNGVGLITLILNVAISSGAWGCDWVLLSSPSLQMSCYMKNTYECRVIFLYEKETILIHNNLCLEAILRLENANADHQLHHIIE